MMKVITFFIPRRGCGKTTAVMATASAMLDAEQRVLVLEIAGDTNRPTLLQNWEDRMVEAGFALEQIAVVPVETADGLSSALAAAKSDGVDYVLVDTPTNSNALVAKAMFRSDLVVVPSKVPILAGLAITDIRRLIRRSVPVVGLVMDTEDHNDEAQVRACFLDFVPVLEATLPHRKLFHAQIENGDLIKSARPGKADQTACEAARALANEIMSLSHDAADVPLFDRGRDISNPAVRASMLAGLLDDLEEAVASDDDAI
jgi:cellulose biosynthesis protein BcsQ